MSRAESLYRLQLLDTDLDAAQKRLQEIEVELAGNPALAHTRAELAKAEKALRDAASDLKDLELDAQALDERITSEEERLYAGKINSPKELLDVQNDLAHTKTRRASLDDEILARMMRVDELRADGERCRRALIEAENHFESDSADLRNERVKLQTAVEANLERRAALSAAIPREDLDLYTSIRAKKPNRVALSVVRSGACTQCGEMASSQQVQQAGTGASLALCSNCGRILYAQ
jgi:predicted  nucleic acid-binding Zn-ribbon protein